MKPVLAYGVNGDGLGHASRALVLAPLLLNHYQLIFFSSQGAFSLLKQHLERHPDCSFVEVPGTHWIYRDGRISVWRSVVRYIWQVIWCFPSSAARIAKLLSQSEVAAVLCDFEPVLARAGKQADLPVLAMSHQHAMVAFRPNSIGFTYIKTQIFSIYMALNAPYRSALLISSFFSPPLRSRYADSFVIGGLLRPEVFEYASTAQSYGRPLLYLRRFSNCRHVLSALDQAGIQADIFGLGAQSLEKYQGLCHHDRDSRKFLQLLADAPYVISASGHQLICEAIELRKPILALYEQALDEPRMNAFMVESLGYGMASELGKFTQTILEQFVNRLPVYRRALQSRVSAQGNPESVVQWVDNQLVNLCH